MFNFTLFFFLTTLSFLIISTIFDLRYREIPNTLILSTLIIGLIFKVIQSVFYSSIFFLLNSLLSVIVVFIVSFIFWELGVFAGGDLKLFVVIAILNPFNLNFFVSSGNIINHSFPLFTILLIIFSILAIIPYFIILFLYNLFSKKYYIFLISELKSKRYLLSLINSILLIFLINSFLNIFNLLVYPLLLYIFSIIFLYIFSKIKDKDLVSYYFLIFFGYLFLLGSVLFGFYDFKDIFIIKDFINIILFIFIFSLLFKIHKIIRNKMLIEEKPIDELREGDVPVSNYYYFNKRLYVKNLSFITVIKEMLKNTYYKNLKIDSNKAGGLDKKNIRFIKYLYKSNLISNRIKIKKTLPFTPAVLIAYIFLNIFGDLI